MYRDRHADGVAVRDDGGVAGADGGVAGAEPGSLTRVVAVTDSGSDGGCGGYERVRGG
ncbi:hypothetical protein [Microbacterium sp. NPDC079995]|uniref:hypothetical protein n=1 Tax=unclassified Microbacterium TaxID=2609290 RepID=UPI00344F6FB7